VGYTPIFDSVFQGSLCGKWPDIGIWALMLAMQDKNGEIDAHPTYISTVTGCPVGEVEACIARFCQPDPSSRTPDEDGRRLIPIAGRGFGWTVVNHRKYRERARLQSRDASRTESGENRSRMAQRYALTPADPRTPPQTRADPPSDADADIRERGANAPARGSRSVPEDFQPDRAYALKEVPDMDVDKEIEKFRDCVFKQAHKDWSRVWRRWVRTCRDEGRYAKRTKGDRFANAI
jgi:hypothetical protein